MPVFRLFAPNQPPAPDPSTPVLVTKGLHKIYASGTVKVHALRGINLTVHRGDFIALLGKSGSGKSTLMNLLGCLDTPTQGQFLFDGEDVGRLSRDRLAHIRNRRVGFIFQGFNLLARTTALENVLLPMTYAGRLTRRDRLQRATDLLTRVGLGDRLDHVPSQLSGGQQQRVAIARALANDPSILLADEPTGNLDTRTSLEILCEFQRLNKDGQTIIMVTHDLETADCASRQIVMRDGQIVSDEPTHHPRDAAAELRALDADRSPVDA